MAKDKEPRRGKVYQSRDPNDAHDVRAVEGTQEDVDAGRVGAVGDFLVTRDRFTAQWWESDAFLSAYQLAE